MKKQELTRRQFIATASASSLTAVASTALPAYADLTRKECPGVVPQKLYDGTASGSFYMYAMSYKADMDDIADAVLKIYQNRDKLSAI